MAEKPDPPAASPQNAPAPSVKKEEDWGEDWESAFQAEEDMFFADSEGGEEESFFIEEEEKKAAAVAPGKEIPPALEKELAGTPARTASLSSIAAAINFPVILAALKDFITQKLSGPAALVRPLLEKVKGLPVALRLAVYISPPLLVALAVFALLLERPDLPPPTVDHPGEAGQRLETTGSETGAPVTQLYPDQARKKWDFPAFIIPVQSETGDKAISFLLIDITLISVLPPGEEPPGDKVNFLRDSIYQFYVNRPEEELRHYSLARGEMNRQLKEWLLKQWPEAPIESIVFNRYFFS